MIVPIIVLAFFVIITFIQLRNPRPLSKFMFRFRVISSVMLLAIVWLLDNPDGKANYKYLLTVMALVSIYAAYVQYRKGRVEKN